MTATEAMRSGMFYNDKATYLRLKDQVAVAERELEMLKERMAKAELLYKTGLFYQQLIKEVA